MTVVLPASNLPPAGAITGAETILTVQAGKVVQAPIASVGAAFPTLVYDTWAHLAARATTGLVDGQSAAVSENDGGAHTDPVTSATVNNAGVYSWHPASPTGWERTDDLPAVQAQAAASAAAASAVVAQDAAVAALANSAGAAGVAIETSNLKGYTQLTDPQLTLLSDSEDNPALLWDLTFEVPDGPMGAQMRGFPPSQTNFPLATIDAVTLLTGGNWNGVLSYGQSLSVGEEDVADPVISTTQPYDNLSFTNGPRSCTIPNTWGALQPTSGGVTNGTQGSAPLAEIIYTPGPDGGTVLTETICSGVANFATERAFIENQVAPTDFVIFTSAPGRGGFNISQLKKGSAWYPNFTDHVSKAKGLATTAGKSFALHAVVWVQGEEDVQQATSYATYKAALIQLQSDIQTDVQAITGQSEPVHLLVCQTNIAANGLTSEPVDQVLPAQLDACNSSTRIHMVGPHFHLPMSTGGVGVHMSALGYLLLGRYCGRALKQLVVDRRRPDWLNPIGVYAKGQTVYVRWNVPARPIVLDTELLSATQNYGFRITDGSGDLTLSNIKVMPSGHTIAISINRTLAASPVCRLGLDYSAAYRSAPGNLGSGGPGFTHNVRDSTKDWTIDPNTGTKWLLSHWSPAFTLPITILDPNA